MSDPTRTKSFEDNIKNLGRDQGLATNTTDQMVTLMVPSIIRSIYRYPLKNQYDPATKRLSEEVLSPETLENNARLEKLWIDLYKTEFPKYDRQVTPIGIFGPPGQGKTSSVLSACRYIAERTGMDFIDPIMLPHIDLEHIGPHSFVAYSQELATANSDIDVIGLPSKQQADGIDYMGRALPLDLLKLNKAGMGVWIFDDALNAIPRVQNMLLPILQSRRFGPLSLPHVYTAMTGNLGGLDGSTAIGASTPLRGRIRSHIAYDTVENFILRNQRSGAYSDLYGDGFVHGFLRRYGAMFAEDYTEIAERKGGFCSSRGWSNAIGDVRDILQRNGGRESVARNEVVEEIQTVIYGNVGPKAAETFKSYIDSVLCYADPVARKVVLAEKYDLKTMKEDFEKAGRDSSGKNAHTSEQQHFAWTFADCLIDYTIAKIRAADSWKEPLKRFGMGIGLLDDAVFNYAVTQLYDGIKNQIDTLEKGSYKVVKEVEVQGSIYPSRSIDSSVLVDLAQLISEGADGLIDQKRVDILSKVLSGTARSGNVSARDTSRIRTRK